jgi:hypothetical protein
MFGPSPRPAAGGLQLGLDGLLQQLSSTGAQHFGQRSSICPGGVKEMTLSSDIAYRSYPGGMVGLVDTKRYATSFSAHHPVSVIANSLPRQTRRKVRLDRRRHRLQPAHRSPLNETPER